MWRKYVHRKVGLSPNYNPQDHTLHIHRSEVLKHNIYGMTSYIISSQLGSMAQSVGTSEMSVIPPSTHPEYRNYVNIEQTGRHNFPPQSLTLSVVLLLLFCRQAATVTFLLTGSYSITGSDSHTHRCFLWGSNWLSTTGRNYFNGNKCIFGPVYRPVLRKNEHYVSEAGSVSVLRSVLRHYVRSVRKN
jgi:hypothetical protein